MTEFPTNPGLEAAVIGDAEDNSPRLVYADWLDENGDPDRASFIRTQVALWDKNAADSNYVELLEREVETRIHVDLSRLTPALPEAVGFLYPETDFRRGFPAIASRAGLHKDQPFRPEDVDEFREALPELFRTTTIRGLRLGLHDTPHLSHILSTPVAAQITALALHEFRSQRESSTTMVADLCRSGVLRQLRWLELTGSFEASDLDHLAKAPFDNLVRLDCETILGPAEATGRFFASLGERRVHRLTLLTSAESVAAYSVLSQLPELHTLELVDLGPAAISALADGKSFPSISRLVLYRVEFGGETGAERLASVKIPNLTALEIVGDQRAEALDAEVCSLARSPLFERLSSLSATHGRITEVGIEAISASPAAKTLRALDVETNAFGEIGLMTIAEPGVFPKLTTLRLGVAGIESRETTPREVAAFLRTWEGHSLRHLDLNYWNLGDIGAKALAGNPAFGGLRWLSLNYTGKLGRAGLRAIVESPHLRNLIYLSFQGTPAERSADLLLDPALLPNLAVCYFPLATAAMKKRLAEVRPCVRWDYSR